MTYLLYVGPTLSEWKRRGEGAGGNIEDGGEGSILGLSEE